MSIDFLVMHKWTQPRLRSTRLYFSTPRNPDRREWKRRQYCIKCGAVIYRRDAEPGDPGFGYGHWIVIYRPLGDIERPVLRIPPCSGHPVEPAAEGA